MRYADLREQETRKGSQDTIKIVPAHATKEYGRWKLWLQSLVSRQH
jgi:hypothetical protein